MTPAMDALFPTNDDDLLISVYLKQGRTLDDLPYTEQFEALYDAMYGALDDGPPRGVVFRRLHNLRKAGKLPRLGRAAGSPPRIDAAHEALLIRVVEDEHGPISTRDQLPYTDTFDRICARFNTEAGLSLSHHDLWRILAKLAK